MSESLAHAIDQKFSGQRYELIKTTPPNYELTLKINAADLINTCLTLRDEPSFKFELLVDLCGIDYLDYGSSEWATESTTTSGFERGVEKQNTPNKINYPERFAVIYHLLSITHNQRLRLCVYVPSKSTESSQTIEPQPTVDSVVSVWASANWYEREAFDLYGIVFLGHPDLRRLLTDYGFRGHPFRKDFPLIGNVEVRYDATAGRVIYQPVSIEPRTLVPKTIRKKLDKEINQDLIES
jgi:NADH-quinone oxidoreductase subunit C